MPKFDVLVLGSGPAGYVGAIKAAQLGFQVAVVEKGDLGGICLNYGCIPTKALLKAASIKYEITHAASNFGLTCGDVKVDFPKVIARSREVAGQLNKGVTSLLKKNKVTVLQGKGVLKDKNTLDVVSYEGKKDTVSFTHLVIATGARPKTFPGLEPNGKALITSKEAMLLQTPPKRLCIIGAGAIGVEFAYFYSQFGTSVTLLEALDRILPAEDEESSQAVARSFKKDTVTIKTGVFVESVESNDKSATVVLKSGEKIEAEKVLLSVGVTGNVEGIGLETVGIKAQNGKIPVNKDYQTSLPHIYAVGDVIGPPWLAHVGSHEAIHAVSHMSGKQPKPINYDHVPGCTYCEPQVASVGYTEQRAKKENRQIKIGRFPFRANGKALASGHVDGFVKLIFDAKYGELIGAHMVGHDVTEMISGLVTLMGCEVTQAEIAHAMHPHPTCSEAIMEAALDAYGEVIHI